MTIGTRHFRPRMGERKCVSIRPIAGGRRAGRGQAMVEFTFIATVALIVLLAGIQFALIGQAALALSHAAFEGARFASINSSADSKAVKAALDGMVSPTISGYSMAMTPTAIPRTFGSSVQVTLTYNATSKILLPNPFLGVRFPTGLTATETAMCE